MKKVFIACFFAIIMLMVPFAAVSQTANISNIKNVSNDKNTSTLDIEIQFFITNSEYNKIKNYIETEIPEEHKGEAYDILNEIASPHEIYGYEVDMIELAEAWEEYGYKSIPEDVLNNPDLTLEDLEALLDTYWAFNLFGELIHFITDLEPIRNRLGWFHRVINDGYYFCVEGAFIALNAVVETVKALRALANAVNFIVSVPETFYKLIDDLFNNRVEEFKNTLLEFTSDFLNAAVGVILYAKSLLSQFPNILNYLTRLGDFVIDMITLTPWNDKIRVHGKIIKNFAESVNVTCRGQPLHNVQGSFDFYVDSNPDETSLPEYSYFGIHDCQITVEKDGKILKQSTKFLSYVFSDGSIYWPFIIIKGRSRSTGFNTFLMEKFNNFLAWIQLIFPNFFRLINRIDTLSI